MRQGVLPFQYVSEQHGEGMTAFAGFGLYLDVLHAAGVPRLADEEIQVRQGQGYRDGQMVAALVLLQLAGGDAVRDIEVLEQDEGLCALTRAAERQGLRRRERGAEEQRWRKARTRTFPSQSAIFRYLAAFHDKAQERRRKEQDAPLAFIPAPNRALEALRRLNRHFVAWVQGVHPQRTATLDMDATLIETAKREALHGYQGSKAYQPLQVYWAEQDLLVESEFRDGNVPAGHEQLRVLRESVAVLPAGVAEVRLRSDTAGYQQDLLLYCGEGEDPRFGVIPFAVGADLTQALREAVRETPAESWHPIEEETAWGKRATGQEWAEVCYVPNWVGHTNRRGTYRYVAVREPVRQNILPGMEGQLAFEALTMEEGRAYKVTALVTNRYLPGEELLRWYRGRCGKSEEVHGVLKRDLAGGRLPSGAFGENAAWWAVTVLCANLHAAVKRLALGGAWAGKRPKAVRYGLVHLAGRVVAHGRQLLVHIGARHPGFPALLAARGVVRALLGARRTLQRATIRVQRCVRTPGLTLFHRVPFTATLLVFIAVAGLVTGTVARDAWPELMQRFGWDLSALQRLELYRPWVALPFASFPGEHPTMLAMLAVGVGTLEYRWGTGVAALGFLVLGPLTSILSVLAQWPLYSAGVTWLGSFLLEPDMGSSSASLVCWGMTWVTFNGGWRGLLVGMTFAVLLLLLVFLPQPYALDHLVAFLAGMLYGTALKQVKGFKGRPA